MVKDIHSHDLTFLKINTCPSGGLEKAMATHSSTLAWRIPWTQEPGGVQSVGSLRVGREQSPAFLRNSTGRLDLPGPTQEAA